MEIKVNSKRIDSVSNEILSNGLYTNTINYYVVNNKTVLQLEKEARYKFTITGLCLSPQSVLVVANKEGTSFSTHYGNKITQLQNGVDVTTPFLKGKEFIFSIFSPEKQSGRFTIKALHFYQSGTSAEVDENGQVYSSALRELDNQAYQPTRSVGRYNGAVVDEGTCWLLGKTNYLVTNAHVIIPAMSGDYSAASVDFLFDGPDGENSYRIEGGNVLKLGTGDTENDHNNDYGIVALDEFDVKYSRMAELVGGLALNTENESSLSGKTIYMPGHPGAKVQRTSYYSDTDTSQRCTLQTTTEQQIKYNCYSAPGASGSPVIAADDRKVLGIDWGVADGDDEGIYRGVKGSHIWEGIKAFIDVNDNVEVTGLAAQYTTVARQASLIVNDDWKELISFSESVSFDGFTGTLTHYDTYSIFSGKALSNYLLEYIVDVNIRVSQKTADGMYNLLTPLAMSADKKLIACVKKEDNLLLFSDDSLYYRSWVNMTAKASDTDTPSGYFIFEVSARSPDAN